MDPVATNYNSLACVDDGSCTYATGPFILTLNELGDSDPNASAGNNGYSTSYQNIGTFMPGDSIPEVGYLQITPNPGVVIRADQFEIQGATMVSSSPPTFTGGSLPSEIDYVKFEDDDNKIYLSYSDPAGSIPNPNYDPNWVPTQYNTVVVIVAIHPGVVMPSNDLDLVIDIDANLSSSNPVVNNVTLT